MFQLSNDQFKKVLPMFVNIQNKAVFAFSVIEQIQRGAIFVNNKENPTSVLLTSCGGFYCLAGSSTDVYFNDRVVHFLNDKTNHIGFYALALFSIEWEEALAEYQLINTNKISRTYFQFNEHKFLENSKGNNVGVNHELEYVRLNDTISNIYREEFYSYYKQVWESNTHFVNNGIGHFLTRENNIISVCSSPYVGGGYAEIDIITIENYKQQGCATIVGIEFITECMSKNIIPNWSCHSDNGVSLHLANKLGFIQFAEHPMYWYNV